MCRRHNRTECEQIMILLLYVGDIIEQNVNRLLLRFRNEMNCFRCVTNVWNTFSATPHSVLAHLAGNWRVKADSTAQCVYCFLTSFFRDWLIQTVLSLVNERTGVIVK